MGKQKTALITGATGGIGEAIAYRLASEGISLQLHYYSNEAKGLELQRKLSQQFGVDVQLYQADLTRSDGPFQLVQQLVPKPNILIHNAGHAHFSLFQDISRQDYDRMIQLQITSPFMITQLLLPSLVTKKWGRIVFITSIWAETGAAYESLYALAKGGITSLMKSLAQELGPSGISVNAVAPGLIDTPMNRSLEAEELAKLCVEIPAGRMGTPAEVAHCVAFLIDSRSDYVSGQTLRVNGGWHM